MNMSVSHIHVWLCYNTSYHNCVQTNDHRQKKKTMRKMQSSSSSSSCWAISTDISDPISSHLRIVRCFW